MKILMTGNEAVARGAWEADVKFASAYPGTPSTEILENIAKYDEIVAEWAPNEKTAVEAVVGASLAGIRSIAAMKHVGMNVAADPMFTFSYLGVNGGSVIITADEPGMFSSQNEQDNRHYARHAKMPMFEPSDSQEAKDMLKDAFALSEEYDRPFIYRLTTRVCHSKSIVEVTDRVEVEDKVYTKNIVKNIPLPAFAKVMQQELAKNMSALEKVSENCKWNFIEDNQSVIGVIASGIAYRYAKEVFGDTASYLKIGFSYPMPKKLIKAFAEKVKTIYIFEENDPVMETEIRAMGIDCIGKDVLPTMGELTPDRVREAIFGEKPALLEPNNDVVVNRPPSFCAGCPHRGLFYELGRKKNIWIFSDIGCYSLGGTAPYNATDAALCMGASISGGHGVAKALKIKGSDTKAVAIIGDSTFFHSGITSLMDATYNQSNLLVIILDNRITGMTGHQDNPGSGFTLKGDPAPIVDIAEVCRAVGVQQIRTINPNDLTETKDALDWGLSNDGVSVIITRWPCALKRFSEADIDEFNQPFTAKCAVDAEKCIGCKACMKCGCPALNFDQHNKKAFIDPNACLGCQVCAQICPVAAIQ